MTEPSSPAASRLRQPKWTDARLVAGVLMVLVAVVAGAAVVSAADRSVQVWAVRRTLRSGTTVERDDLVARRVRLFGADLERYVDVRRSDPAGRVLVRDIGEGELLPISALADPSAKPASRIVGIPVDRSHALGGELERGDLVDVLATRRAAGGSFTTSVVATNVRIDRISRPSGGFGGGQGELVVLVEVDPEQAVEIAAAVQSAELDLSLVVAGSDGTGDAGDRVVTGTSPPPAS